MRGRRFGRPAARKKNPKDRREQLQASMPYHEETPVDLSQLRSATLNSLEHLGNQHFALPPYSEHFQRWLKDITNLLSDFETQLPEDIDQQYKESVEKTMFTLQTALKQRAETENDASDKQGEAQRRLAAYESELLKLDHDYRARINELRKSYEQSFTTIKHDIDTIDRERLRILHAKPNLLQKLFRRSNGNLEEKTNTLRSRKETLDHRKEALKQDLEKNRLDFEDRRKRLAERLDSARAELDESKDVTLDDALDIRKTACEEFRRAVTEVVDRQLQPKIQTLEGEQ